MLCRVYKRADGSTVVLHPNPRLKLDTETEAQFLERICQKDAPKSNLVGLPCIDIDTERLPNRADRDKWDIDTTKKEVHIKKP